GSLNPVVGATPLMRYPRLANAAMRPASSATPDTFFFHVTVKVNLSPAADTSVIATVFVSPALNPVLRRGSSVTAVAPVPVMVHFGEAPVVAAVGGIAATVAVSLPAGNAFTWARPY